MATIICVIIFIITSIISSGESAVWTSLNNRGVVPKVKDREPQIASSSQLVNNYALLDKDKGKQQQFPKVVYNNPHGDIISSASNLIRDDVDIGFDHEDDSGGPIETTNPNDSVYANANFKVSSAEVNDNLPKDVGLVGRVNNANNDPVTVIPSPPTVSPLWFTGDRYGRIENDQSYRHHNKSNINSNSNELIKFDDVTPIPPLPMASTRSPRRIIRARKRPQKGKDSSTKGAPNRSSDKGKVDVEVGVNRNIVIVNTAGPNNRVSNQADGGQKEPAANSFESLSPPDANFGEPKSNSIDRVNQPKIKSYSDLSSQWDVNPFGQPGIDFPSFASPPLTSFRCSSQRYPGYYADPEAYCQAFYICQPDGREDAFLCPNGTLFNQKYFICDWYYNVDCGQARSFYSLNSLLYIESTANRNKKSARLQAPPDSTVDGSFNKGFEDFDSSYEIEPRRRADNRESSGENESEFVYPLKADQEDGKPSSSLSDNQRSNQPTSKKRASETVDSNLFRRQETGLSSKEDSSENSSAEIKPKPKARPRKQTNWWIAEDLTNNLGSSFGGRNSGKQPNKTIKRDGRKSVNV